MNTGWLLFTYFINERRGIAADSMIFTSLGEGENASRISAPATSFAATAR